MTPAYPSVGQGLETITLHVPRQHYSWLFPPEADPPAAQRLRAGLPMAWNFLVFLLLVKTFAEDLVMGQLFFWWAAPTNMTYRLRPCYCGCLRIWV